MSRLLLSDEAIGKNRAGNTGKIHLTVDVHGLPIECEITGGQVSDGTQAPALIAKRPAAETIVTDKGHDSAGIWRADWTTRCHDRNPEKA